MVMNTVEFGELVRAARDDRSQDLIDQKGGPPRQRQTQIERGDAVDLSPAVLKQLDTAYEWTPGTAEALLSRPEPPTNLATALAELPATAFAIDSAGDPVELPSLLMVDSPQPLVEVVRRWPGPVLIGGDRTVPDSAFRFPIDLELLDQQRLRRAGLNSPPDVAPVAIDPIKQLRRYDDAINLFRRLDQADLSYNLDDVRLAAFTLLFVVSEAHRRGCSGIAALSLFAEEQLSPAPAPARLRWMEFYRSSGLSSRFMTPFPDLPVLLRSVAALYDFHIDLALTDTEDDNALAITRSSSADPLAVSDLNNSIVLYDPDQHPDLPILIDWAQPDPAHPQLVILSPEWYSRYQDLPDWHNSRFVLVHKKTQIISPTPDSLCRLVLSKDAPQRATLLPSIQVEHEWRPNNIWLPMN